MGSPPSPQHEFLHRLCRAIRQNPERFVGGGKVLDEQFALAVLRAKRAQQLCDLRREVPRNSFYRLHMEDPVTFEYGRWGPTEAQWKRHLRAMGMAEEGWLPTPCPPALERRRKSRPVIRLREAVEWALQCSTAYMSLEAAQAICVTAWLLFDRTAEEVRPLLCEFQGLPWEPWSTVRDEPYQGRGVLAEILDDQLAQRAKLALEMIETSALNPLAGTARGGGLQHPPATPPAALPPAEHQSGPPVSTTPPAQTTPDRPPLGDQARLMYQILCALPETEGRRAKDLVKEMSGAFKGIDEDRIRKLAQELNPYGIQRHGSAGYYIPLSLRPARPNT